MATIRRIAASDESVPRKVAALGALLPLAGLTEHEREHLAARAAARRER